MALNNVAKINRTWHYNLIGHFFVLLFIFIVLCLVVIVKDSLFLKQVQKAEQSWYEYSKYFNLYLDDIVIEGRHNISKDKILGLLNLTRDSSFLAIDEDELENKIKTLPWAKDVDVKKNYIPNILKIKIQEKEVVALFQQKNKFYPIDEKGQIIDEHFVPKQEYIVVTGDGAQENVAEILKTLKTNEKVFNRVKALQYVSNRRWNVVLDNIVHGKTIKLPEKKVDEAWKKLLKLNITHGVLKRPLTIIDLRFEDKVIFKLDKEVITRTIKEVKA